MYVYVFVNKKTPNFNVTKQRRF